MSGTDVDLSDVLAGLQDLNGVLKKHGRDVFTEARKDIKADMREQKRNRTSATGIGWAPRAQSTRDRAQRDSKTKRRKSASTGLLGKLTSAWSGKVEPGGVELENQVPFATAHHEGATIGHGAQLPARPHMDIKPERVEDVVEALEELAVDAWEGASDPL